MVGLLLEVNWSLFTVHIPFGLVLPLDLDARLKRIEQNLSGRIAL